MLREEVDPAVAALRARGVMAHAHQSTNFRHGIRVVLPGGREAIWDVDGAAGLEAMIMANGNLVGFVPHIPGSEDFTFEQTIEAIATTDYDRRP
jgi:hypothetical protein